jgi:hypothetical protein
LKQFLSGSKAIAKAFSLWQLADILQSQFNSQDYSIEFSPANMITNHHYTRIALSMPLSFRILFALIFVVSKPGG